MSFKRQIRSHLGRKKLGGLLTRLEVARFLRVNQSTLWLWRKRGIGPRCLRLSGYLIRYRYADVESWLSKSEKGAALT